VALCAVLHENKVKTGRFHTQLLEVTKTHTILYKSIKDEIDRVRSNQTYIVTTIFTDEQQ